MSLLAIKFCHIGGIYFSHTLLMFINAVQQFSETRCSIMETSWKASDQKIMGDALKIVNEGAKLKVNLRLLGALAIRIHCEEFSELHRKLKRLGSEDRVFTDIDLIGYSKERNKVRMLMEDVFGFRYSDQFMLMHGKERLLYFHPEGLYHVDIFFDKLKFSHDIYFGSSQDKGRLSLDFPTISLADLLLEKLQIHEINEKDIKDIIVLLRAHDISVEDQKEAINAKYIAKVLADDWGFWYDAKMNLDKVRFYMGKYLEDGILSKMDFEDVCGKLEKLINFIDGEPKTKNWKKREKIGTNKKWWRPVEEIMR